MIFRSHDINSDNWLDGLELYLALDHVLMATEDSIHTNGELSSDERHAELQRFRSHIVGMSCGVTTARTHTPAPRHTTHARTHARMHTQTHAQKHTDTETRAHTCARTHARTHARTQRERETRARTHARTSHTHASIYSHIPRKSLFYLNTLDSRQRTFTSSHENMY